MFYFILTIHKILITIKLVQIPFDLFNRKVKRYFTNLMEHGQLVAL